jgi:hypothetical protein
MNLYSAFIALRLIPLDGASYGEAAEYAMNINTFPLSQADNPSKGDYIDMAGKHLPTLPVYDLSFLKISGPSLPMEKLPSHSVWLKGSEHFSML